MLSLRIIVLSGALTLLAGVLAWRWAKDWGLVTLNYSNAPLSKVIGSIERQGRVQISTNADPSTSVTIRLKRASVFEAFDIQATQPNLGDPVYDPAYEAKPMLTELGPYGVTKQLLRCPEDLRAGNYFAQRGSSYQWSPILDGELKVNPVVYGRRGGTRAVNPARMRICMDFEAVHFNRAKRLYADGHVVAALK